MNDDYQLLDSGAGAKLERWGRWTLCRPEAAANWPPALTLQQWQAADGDYRDGRGWRLQSGVPKRWVICHGGMQFWIEPGGSKQVGLFPEQAPNWQWLQQQIAAVGRSVSLLNLFAYTGGATLAALQAGASVCHVDSAKAAVQQARDNAKLNQLEALPVRWIVDDAAAFLRREQKRGQRYDAIVLDPPAFGRGSKGQVFKLTRDLGALLQLCAAVLSAQPVFVLLNAYVAEWSAADYQQAFRQALGPGLLQSVDLTLSAQSGAAQNVAAGFALRWLPPSQ